MLTSFMVRYEFNFELAFPGDIYGFWKRIKPFIVFIKRMQRPVTKPYIVLLKSGYEVAELQVTITGYPVSREALERARREWLVDDEKPSPIRYTVTGTLAIILDTGNGRENLPLLDIMLDYCVVHRTLLRPM